MPLGQLFFWTVPVVALASYTFLMIFLSISEKDELIRIFMVVLSAFLIWTAASLLMRLQIYPGVLFWSRVMVTAMIAVPIFLYFFVSVFANSLNLSSLVIWLLLTLAAIVANWMGLIVPDAQVVTTTVLFHGRPYDLVEFSYSLGSMCAPVYIFTFVLVFATILKARESVRNGNSGNGQMGLITAGALIMFLGVFLNIFPSVGKYPVDILSCFINAVLIIVSIFKYRMLELRFILEKGIIYTVLSILVTAVYVCLVIFVDKGVGALFQNASTYLTIISALVIALVCQPLFRLVRIHVDGIFLEQLHSEAARFGSGNLEKCIKQRDYKENGLNDSDLLAFLGTPTAVVYDDICDNSGYDLGAEIVPGEPSMPATVYALTAAIDAKDHYTFGHSQRVADYAEALAESVGLDKDCLYMIREAALLHDIGKIGIPESIITKKGRLSPEELDIVKSHVDMSINIIKYLPFFHHVCPAVFGHHERWDGTGYPRGLKGEEIPPAARCLAIADAFDAMTSDRPYRSSLSVEAALQEIENNIGTQFDPYAARLFIELIREGKIGVGKAMDPPRCFLF